MTITRGLLKQALEFRAVYASDVWKQWAAGGDLPGTGTDAGVNVTRDSALRMSAVFACVRLLSEDVATLPVGTFARDGAARHPVPKPTWMVRPNGEFTWVEVVQQLMTGMLTDGNGAWEIVRDRFEDPLEVWPRDSQYVTPRRNSSTGRPEFEVQDPETGGIYTVPSHNMLYVRAFTLPGRTRGVSPIEYARQTIGTGLAAEKFSARFFGYGAQAGGVIEFPHDATEEQINQFITLWKQHHQGIRNAHEPGVLTGGATWKQTTIPPEHAQFIESRKFSVAEIARFFGVQPHKIGDLERATFSNIEQQAIEYVVDSLRPWLVRLEAALTVLLPSGVFPKWNVEGLLRGDTLARYTAYTQARNAGWMSVNEIRALEDRNPIADGDNYLQPLNMGPLGVNPLDQKDNRDAA
ncbi:MAG: phage portal protein [Actinomycetota bacterium]|nr:phage portal protein [Actinomycetota bacterium]